MDKAKVTAADVMLYEASDGTVNDARMLAREPAEPIELPPLDVRYHREFAAMIKTSNRSRSSRGELLAECRERQLLEAHTTIARLQQELSAYQQAERLQDDRVTEACDEII